MLLKKAIAAKTFVSTQIGSWECEGEKEDNMLLNSWFQKKVVGYKLVVVLYYSFTTKLGYKPKLHMLEA